MHSPVFLYIPASKVSNDFWSYFQESGRMARQGRKPRSCSIRSMPQEAHWIFPAGNVT
jgi:hypothetical protein